MRHLLAVVFVGLASAVFPSEVMAQERQGLWGGVGGGWGSAGISCDEDCGEDREGSGVGYFRLGWTLNERTLVSGDFHLWNKKAQVDEDVDMTLNFYNFLGAITFYPQPASGFFVKGGVGVSFVDVDLDFGGSNLTADLGSGVGLIVGAGYDIRVARIVSITPGVSYWYGRPGDLKVGSETLFGGFSHNVIEFTVGITIH